MHHYNKYSVFLPFFLCCACSKNVACKSMYADVYGTVAATCVKEVNENIEKTNKQKYYGSKYALNVCVNTVHTRLYKSLGA